ncbi:hypothetical protein F4821DRAFT_225703 [Hypoxylon rubiginosum]|uniref:Uncharacterized protein n=1 Tax=Hypoxylon rubiginosum TaxID=110542 RepID=A0ACC0DGI5_9PEZI|nr:hypothetical protein F4821DRAFT_225703 [Hypoxylon rubiginosum]
MGWRGSSGDFSSGLWSALGPEGTLLNLDSRVPRRGWVLAVAAGVAAGVYLLACEWSVCGGLIDLSRSDLKGVLRSGFFVIGVGGLGRAAVPDGDEPLRRTSSMFGKGAALSNDIRRTASDL